MPDQIREHTCPVVRPDIASPFTCLGAAGSDRQRKVAVSLPSKRAISLLPVPLGRNDLHVSQVFDLAGGDDHVFEYITAVREPLDGARAVFEAGHEALDVEPAV